MASSETIRAANCRHCAYCLVTIASHSIRLCGRCRKRSYCSRVCQKRDWGTAGQHHRLWCSLECGEEDIDWEIRWISDTKGVGVFAKRDLPAYYRIMVDRAYSSITTHAPLMRLTPQTGSLAEKFQQNALGCGEETEGDNGNKKSVLCARVARVNHNCANNADHLFDAKNNVVFLFSERVIRAGEEVCIAYVQFSDQASKSDHLAMENYRLTLKQQWGISCPRDCACRDAIILQCIEYARQLDDIIHKLAPAGNVTGALVAIEMLIKLHDEQLSAIGFSSAVSRMRTLYSGFQLAITTINQQEQALKYLKTAYSIACSVTSPFSPLAIKYKTFLENPASHRNYRLMG